MVLPERAYGDRVRRRGRRPGDVAALRRAGLYARRLDRTQPGLRRRPLSWGRGLRCRVRAGGRLGVSFCAKALSPKYVTSASAPTGTIGRDVRRRSPRAATGRGWYPLGVRHSQRTRASAHRSIAAERRQVRADDERNVGRLHGRDGWPFDGGAGVCVATVGPGATNLTTAWVPPGWTARP